MRNIIIGLSLMLISSLLYSSNLIAAAVYSGTVAKTSWDRNAGIFGTALEEVSFLPIYMITLIFIIGLVILILEVCSRDFISKMKRQ
ncbi:phosphatase [Salinicoccus cyprini]|uniref:Phosphatase n=1 Tax=Salinicoccus cyprini TaxID=2493691 RepID=A0A558AYQ4_9STAP|nr:phosphatase [Salinicoccus cyprini]TVT29401.1 phosphatase [Salinicoccus cyprini]